MSVDDIYPGFKFELVVNYMEDVKLSEVKEFSEEILILIKSFKVSTNS